MGEKMCGNICNIIWLSAYLSFYHLRPSTSSKKKKLSTINCPLEWVSVSLIGKVSDGCIKNLGFNPRLHQKLIGILI